MGTVLPPSKILSSCRSDYLYVNSFFYSNSNHIFYEPNKHNPFSGHMHGRNLVEDTGDVSHSLFQTGGHNMPCPPTFLSLGFVFGEVSKIKVMFVAFLCEELSNVRR